MRVDPAGAVGARDAAVAVRERLAAHLVGEVDLLVDSFLAELRSIEGYSTALADGTLTDGDLRETALASFELLIRVITGREVPDRLREVSVSVGRDRAAAGVPLGSVVQAMRLTFRLIWTAMLARAEPEDHAGLLESAVDVWEAVEAHIMDAIRGYQEAEALLARERADAKAFWFSRLLEREGRPPELVQRVATVLDFAVDGEFAVVVARMTGDRQFRGAAIRLAATGVHCHLQSTSLGDVFVAQVSEGRSGLSLLAEFDGVDCGVVASTKGLSSVPRAAGLGSRIAQSMATDMRGPRHLPDVWISVIAGELATSLGPELAATCLAPFEGLLPSERDRILETVQVYLDSSSSIGATAEALYCHRNTIHNRLHRFEELTGLDVARPADAAVALLAFALAPGVSGDGWDPAA